MAAEYFQLGGYEINRQSSAFMEAETADPEISPARVFVWADETVLAESSSLTAAQKGEREAREKNWLQRFSVEMRTAPGVPAYFLVPQRLGLSSQFISDATRILKGGVRVPSQFFDAGYRYDEGGKRARASVTGSIFETAAKLKRVPQAFFRRHGLGDSEKVSMQGDVVAYLQAWIAKTEQGSRFCLIEGSAGSGKTVAFNALATNAYRAFMEHKLRQGKENGRGGNARRPIMFLPHHLRATGEVGHIADIMAAAADTDMAAPVTPHQFRWLLANGFTLWMFDGLDEFYEGSEGFFDELASALDAPDSCACIIVCTRDSLLTSSEAMRAFVQSRLAGKGASEILELAPWDEAAWRVLAAQEFGEGAMAQKFVSLLANSPVMAELARLPYYCSVLVERFKTGGKLPSSEFELLDTVFESMIGREHDKAIFRWSDFADEDLLCEVLEEEVEKAGGLPADTAKARQLIAELLDRHGRENLIELLMALAHSYRRTDTQSEPGWVLDSLDLKELTDKSYVANELDGAGPSEETRSRKLTVLVQFAFFGAGRRGGTVDFTHPILADYLAGRYALILLRRHAGAFARQSQPRPSDYANPKAAIQQAVGTAPLETGSIFFQYIAQEAAKDAGLKAFLKAMGDVSFERPNAAAFMREISAILER